MTQLLGSQAALRRQREQLWVYDVEKLQERIASHTPVAPRTSIGDSACMVTIAPGLQGRLFDAEHPGIE
jgi:hypothetical protein